MKSEEAKHPRAKAALLKEQHSHEKRGTWDLKSVREYEDWMRDPNIPEAVFGRLFTILGRKNAEAQVEETDAEMQFKARTVFQGNNVRVKSGRSPYEIFEDISNAPANLTSARCAIAVAILKKMVISYRDAMDA